MLPLIEDPSARAAEAQAHRATPRRVWDMQPTVQQLPQPRAKPFDLGDVFQIGSSLEDAIHRASRGTSHE